MRKITPDDALEYHRLGGKPGKLAIVPTKPMATQHDLALAYTPGVAVPVLEIAREPDLAYEYTAKGNLVAVISNGTAILGLGDRGALAGKPVMEGKAVLFKKFADVDVFDIELDSHDPAVVIQTVKAIAPTFGGINLEDIKAPECFEIEETLRAALDIPVFHDDQHGTAIISGAALLNALELVGKRLDEVRVCISGAGAAAISCAELMVRLGVRRERILLVDSRGVIYRGRTESMNKYKERFATETSARTLADAVAGADVFYGLSAADVLKPEMLATMAERPLVFAMANPDPEINYELARADAARCHHRHRPLGLPQPDQQRARLPVHLSRRAGCAGAYDQRGDEGGGCARPGRPGAGGCARQRAARLRPGEPALRPGLHRAEAAGPAADPVGVASGGGRGHGDRRGATAARSGRLSRTVGLPAGQGRADPALPHPLCATLARGQTHRLR